MLPQKRIRKISSQYSVYGVELLLTSSPPLYPGAAASGCPVFDSQAFDFLG
jgi:hypothetical protein